MTQETDPAYLRARELEEREAAAAASCMVKDVHLELAEEYHARAEAAEGQGAAERQPG